MKIITDIRLLAKGGVSGIEEYTRSMLTEMLKNAEDEFVLFYSGFLKKNLPSDWLSNSAVSIFDGRIPNKMLDLAVRISGFPKIESLVAGDVVWSPHFNLIKTKLKRVITFHDLSFLHHPDFFGRKQSLWHWFQNVAEQAKEASSIIAVSEFTKSDLMHFFGISEEKIHIVYSGIDASFQVLPEGDPRLLGTRAKYKLEKQFILSLGTIEPRKNLIALIDAFSLLRSRGKLQNTELVLAGARGWLAEETFRAARRSPFARDIRFLGRIEPGDRPALYNLASVFAYPSFFEGFGFPPLEAQACGVPVIASNRTSLPEILSDSAQLIDPWATEDLAAALYLCDTSEEHRQTLIRRGLDNARRFSWNKTAQETRLILRSAAGV